MRHWANQYTMTPYEKMNCAELVERVQRDQFGRDFKFPQSLDGNVFNESKLLKENYSKFVKPQKITDGNYEEGDLILMHASRRMAHVGILCIIKHKLYCLHSFKKSGFVMLHRLRDLPELSLFLEGVYKWQK